MGLRIATHAQGEEPIGIVLAGVEEARSKNPQAQLRAPASSTAAFLARTKSPSWPGWA
jgi:hypothetical protein